MKRVAMPPVILALRQYPQGGEPVMLNQVQHPKE